MRRIALAVVLTISLTFAPLGGEAQPVGKVRIGYLSGNPPSDTADGIAAFRTRLGSLGYIEGQNLVIESRYAEGRYEQLPQLASELVRLNVNVILAYGTPGSIAAKNATTTVPIVFSAVADPLAAGLVATMTRPGGNVTGVTTNNPELSGKRLSMLKDIVPTAARVAIFANPDFPATSEMVAETQAAARSLGVKLQVVKIRQPQELAKAFGSIRAARAHAVVVLPDPMFIAQRQMVVELAAENRIPAVYHLRQFAAAGGLISYGVDYSESFAQAAGLVDRILRGAKAANLPVEQPWRYTLVVNLKTANALGLTIPQSILLRADQVIE